MGDVGVDDRVLDLAATPLGVQQVGAPKHPQMLGDKRLGRAGGFYEFVHARRLLAQRFQDVEPQWMAEGPQQFGGGVQPFGRFVHRYIVTLLCDYVNQGYAKVGLVNETVRLSKRMAELGMTSRRQADEWISNGWVRVDGVVVDVLGTKIDPDAHITIDETATELQADLLTVILNKPIGYVSGQAEDGHLPAAVLVTEQNRWARDHCGVAFPVGRTRRLVPAGRLDLDSNGLLVLTEDGRVARTLIGDRGEAGSPIDKEYLVQVERYEPGPLSARGLDLLRHGLHLDRRQLLPAVVEWVSDDTLRFVLREGRKRQIRRMCGLVGLDVVALRRIRVGNVQLGDLPVGKWRALAPEERF